MSVYECLITQTIQCETWQRNLASSCTTLKPHTIPSPCVTNNISLPEEGRIFDGTFHQHDVEHAASVEAAERTLALCFCPFES